MILVANEGANGWVDTAIAFKLTCWAMMTKSVKNTKKIPSGGCAEDTHPLREYERCLRCRQNIIILYVLNNGVFDMTVM